MTRSAVVIVAALVALALAGLALRHTRGFRPRVVVAGTVFRAAQPSPAELTRAARALGLRTVINLRGHAEGEAWFVAEQAACRGLGVRHDEIHVKVDDFVAAHEARRLVALLESEPKPVLLHCKNGVDRTGWAAAVASLLAGAPLGKGLAELSRAQGHVCNPATCPLDRFFALYRADLARRGVTHDAATFRRWVLEAYCPPPYDAAIDVREGLPPRELAAGEPVTVTVEVANRSAEPWRLSRGEHGVRLGVRALGPSPTPPADPLAIFRTPNNPARDLARTGVEDGVVPPGGSRSFAVVFAAPREPGRYVLQIDMVDEHVHWFSDLGHPGVLVEFVVARD